MTIAGRALVQGGTRWCRYRGVSLARMYGHEDDRSVRSRSRSVRGFRGFGWFGRLGRVPDTDEYRSYKAYYIYSR